MLVVLGTSAAWAADPFARASVVTQGTLYPGQQIEIAVDVLVPNFFMSPAKFPLFDLPGAVVTLPDSAENLNETVDGETFVGIRRTYLITPQAAGDYALPPTEITFTYAAVPGQATQGKVALPPMGFTVASAPGAAAGGGPPVTAARISVDQSLDRDLDGIKAGDTLVRTVAITAEGMQAMLIPAPDFEAPDGVRIYPHDPKLEDEKTPRGAFVAGKRTDKVTYAFAKPGSYELPAVEVAWFDPASGKNETAEAPAITVSVANAAPADSGIAPPAPPEAAAPPWKGVDWRRWLPIAAAGVAGLAAALWLVLSVLPKMLARARLRRHEKENSEAAFFERFEKACREGKQEVAYASLDAWARRCGFGPLSDWMRRHGSPEAQQAYALLQKSIFDTTNRRAKLDLRKLGENLTETRRTWLRQHDARVANGAVLPPLNP